MRLALTTTNSCLRLAELQLFLQDTGLPFLERKRQSLAKLIQENELDGIVVWGENGPSLRYQGEVFFFHPNMSKNRHKMIKLGQEDAMLRAAGLQAGDSFLDCTLGIGSDAIIAAAYSKTGRVVGLESVPILAAVVKWGMYMYDCKPLPWLRPALNQIEVINSDHLVYLKDLPDRSFDTVYFDPMFRTPLTRSHAIGAMRNLANSEPLTVASVQEACRVARKSVVMKEAAVSTEFARLGFAEARHGSGSPVAYGVIRLG